MKGNFSACLQARAKRFRQLKASGEGAPVEALSLEVTRRCLARCVMCNIWRMEVEGPELAAGEWLDLLASPGFSQLKELDITGGEPFLRDDLSELLLGVGRLKAKALPQLRSIAITTNGFLTQRLLAAVGEVIAPLERAGIALVFACGLDGIGAVHEHIRGVSGGWPKLHASIEGLKALRAEHPSLVLGIKTTVSRHNIDELEAICRYADTQGLFSIISPYIVTANRYANLGAEEELALTAAQTERLKQFYASARIRWSYYRKELLRFLDTGRMEKPCSAGFNYFFIRSTGELFACPIIAAPLGNIRQAPFIELIQTPAATRFRQGVSDFPECASCTEPGLERYALPFEGSHYLRLYQTMAPEEFQALHDHLGLEKYFP